MISEARDTQQQCVHCGEPCTGGARFCCNGCKMVYELLEENGLCRYYTLNEKPGLAQRAPVRKDKFAFLDDERTQQLLLQYKDAEFIHVTFLIPAIHCSSCLWLLENLSRLDAGVQQVQVNFTRKEAKIIYRHASTSMRKVAETLTAIGYEPCISLQDLKKQTKPSNRKLIYQLGVAGFCFANIMLLSFPEYFSRPGHMESGMSVIFRYLNLALSLPVVFFSAQAFYKPAWKGLRHGFLNIDAPIVLAILVTFVRSLADVISGTGAGYFDSMTGIVLFMLIGRLLQEKTYQGLTFDRDYTAYFPIAVTVITNETEIPTRLPDVKNGDTLLIHHEELVPADGILVRGKALIDYSFVTGESAPVLKQTGEIIYAGGRQLEGNMELLVIKEVAQSYLTSLWNRDDLREEQRPKASFIHLLGQYFSWVVLTVAAVTALYWGIYDASKIWPSVTAILIIACPCALLLAASFTNGHILRILSRHRLYLRNAQAIESLAGTSHIVFDKTGTLTGKQSTVTEWHGRPLSLSEKSAIAAVAASSRHPFSVQVREHCGKPVMHTVGRFSEQPGMGLQGWVHQMHIQLGSATYTGAKEPGNSSGSTVHLNINGDHAGYFLIRHAYRKGMEPMLKELQKGYRLSLISGDQPGEAGNLRKMMGAEAVLKFRQQAHDKLDYILGLRTQGEQVLMIGDGLNDAGALKQSNTGISLAENSNNFTPASNGILEASQLHKLPAFIRLCKINKRIILFSFAYSTAYNITGLFFAVQGHLSPLTAAILMPASSISIILLTYALSEWAGRRLLR
ncbi:heavy metal translocating P-type ATPase [Chitinophaga sp. 22620]|uniref:heavy metal translocating P-type ATPase n=1 Tax=Chitinophaga sp. 22620 TaxID=3453952 RepID=UPI003F837F43